MAADNRTPVDDWLSGIWKLSVTASIVCGCTRDDAHDRMLRTLERRYEALYEQRGGGDEGNESEHFERTADGWRLVDIAPPRLDEPSAGNGHRGQHRSDKAGDDLRSLKFR